MNIDFNGKNIIVTGAGRGNKTNKTPTFRVVIQIVGQFCGTITFVFTAEIKYACNMCKICGRCNLVICSVETIDKPNTSQNSTSVKNELIFKILCVFVSILRRLFVFFDCIILLWSIFLIFTYYVFTISVRENILCLL